MDRAEKMEAIAERIGAHLYSKRIQKERDLHAKYADGRGIGFRFTKNYGFYDLVIQIVRLSGLWDRGVRNYLDIGVEEREVMLADLPKAFDGYRILQLTDLHADLHPEFPAALKRAIDGLEYDCVALTGDFRTCTYREPHGGTAATKEILSCISKPIYAVLGNHDSIEKVPILEDESVQFLLNEHIVIERDGASIALIGIDDPNFYETHCFKRAMLGVPENTVRILLSHSPETYKEAESLGIDFLLAGHTHGGQICLPGGGVVRHDGTVPRRLLSGAWHEGRLQGYTSRGAGASVMPIRFNCPPEVTIHTLRRG